MFSGDSLSGDRSRTSAIRVRGIRASVLAQERAGLQRAEE